jgi:oxygen-independent coproporphyrinogen-3 oxidase
VTGLYVHVPFCSALCPYCDFAVVVGGEQTHARYLEALAAEARARVWKTERATLFVGGGTPTFVDPALLSRALAEIIDAAAPSHIDEFTVEANPDSAGARALATLRAAGVDRISIGAQSFDDAVLRALGRTHDSGSVATAVRAAGAAGIENVSLDLIYGGPAETDASWRASLDAALALQPQHISCYALTIEERTPFGAAVARKQMRAPDDDALARRFDIACDTLGEAGLRHYEISNWARAGFESKHNLVYWTQGEYAGLGLGAHSHRGGARWWNTRALQRYLADPANARDGEEQLDDAARAEEWLSLRMRILEPIPLGDIEAKLGRAPDVEALRGAGLVTVEHGALALTQRGMLLENEVTARLLETRNQAKTSSV